ncbi:NifB/NifX family molybdenum-iron cluster-binding protein [Paenibacillus sp. S150]|uniref:NifB/NifX family molybdenum-iron cluster-binding protein n=1 Tax=Paenibacillus sp. S150 TaxID=2749826 RepID=UPI001C56029F|nr:NifB/NifX family molybdenum-iron cluster-binding protein [Paenibacillus sp. S150]MBW4080350.1 dinitrogenase iron-molybdenum cofactor biosynthesis protein [Paenibacillus sp. S150]
MSWKVAVGSSDGYVINEHFGRCSRFLIYEIETDGTYSQIENRSTERRSAGQGGHDANQLQTAAEVLADCAFVLVSQIGPGARAVLHDRGIQAMAVQSPIEQALERLTSFLRSGRESILK